MGSRCAESLAIPPPSACYGGCGVGLALQAQGSPASLRGQPSIGGRGSESASAEGDVPVLVTGGGAAAALLGVAGPGGGSHLAQGAQELVAAEWAATGEASSVHLARLPTCDSEVRGHLAAGNFLRRALDVVVDE